MKFELPKVTARVALMWALTLTLVISVLGIAAHDIQAEDHVALHCSFCVTASQVDNGDTSTPLPLLDGPLPTLIEPTNFKSPSTNLVPRGYARGPPR